MRSNTNVHPVWISLRSQPSRRLLPRPVHRRPQDGSEHRIPVVSAGFFWGFFIFFLFFLPWSPPPPPPPNTGMDLSSDRLSRNVQLTLNFQLRDDPYREILGAACGATTCQPFSVPMWEITGESAGFWMSLRSATRKSNARSLDFGSGSAAGGRPFPPQRGRASFKVHRPDSQRGVSLEPMKVGGVLYRLGFETI